MLWTARQPPSIRWTSVQSISPPLEVYKRTNPIVWAFCRTGMNENHPALKSPAGVFYWRYCLAAASAFSADKSIDVARSDKGHMKSYLFDATHKQAGLRVAHITLVSLVSLIAVDDL